jgi:RNA polymerase sigma-70 factor (ECF subfamily)
VTTERLLSTPFTTTDVEVRAACVDVFQQEFDYLCRTLRRLGARAADVEDLAHEVFLVLMRRWDDYDASLALRPWLFGIAYRVVCSHRRKSAREVPHALVEPEDPRPKPEQKLVSDEARAIVLEALERVPMERRAVLVMHDLDDTSMHDIASALSIPLFTAYSRLRKSRKEFEAAVRLIQKRGSLR